MNISKYKNLLFYACMTGFFGALMYIVAIEGKLLEAEKTIKSVLVNDDHFSLFKEAIHHNLTHPLATLILQIITIIITARIFGFLFTKIKQPSVIGEIVAGIFLGPSLIGSLFPEFSAFLFPASSLGNLQMLSQVGLILFMYVIGMELDLSILKNKASDAVVISHASIVIPFALGMSLAYFIYVEYAPATSDFLSFALFMGIAMSITAFPVLARIVQERQLTKTRLGTMVITCAAADDITAWCLLAAVIAIVKAGSFVSALYTIALAAVYVVFMLYVVRPILQRLGDTFSAQETMSKGVVAIFFIVLLLSSYASDVIGIHALFGAFMAGVLMPSNINFRKVFIEKVEDVSLVLLLPLFFVFTGLRTQIGLLNDSSLWGICLLIISVAVVGKFLGSAIAAKFVGQTWRDSLVIGALMNTRGLMELVVLNIGYDLGILTAEVFAMMVLMALITTFMTGPALDFIYFLFPDTSADGVRKSKKGRFQILLSFGPPEMGSTLLKLANILNAQHEPIAALHMTPSADLNPNAAEIFEREGFAPIRKTAEELKAPIQSIYKATMQVQSEIVTTANSGYDLLLVGGAKPIFSQNSVGGKVKSFLDAVECSIGVLVNRNFTDAKRILLLFARPQERFLLDIAKKMLSNPDNSPELLIWNHCSENEAPKSWFELGEKSIVTEFVLLNKENLSQFDLVVLSVEYWHLLNQNKAGWLHDAPSILIIQNEKRHTSEHGH